MIFRARRWFFALLLLNSGVASAWVDFSLGWTAVDFTAGEYRVQAVMDRSSHRLSSLTVEAAGSTVSLHPDQVPEIPRPELQKITVTVRAGRQQSDEPARYYLTVPFLVPESQDPKNGRLVSGGSWILHFEGDRFVGREFAAPQADEE